MTDTTPAEATFHPTTCYRPSARLLAWPPAFADVLAEYDRTHEEWSLAHHELHESIARVPLAEAEDASAFARTVAEGSKPDPRGRATRARLDVDAQVIRTARARERATASTDALKAAVREHGADLVPAVVESIRQAAEDYGAALDRARTELGTAAARLRDAAALPVLVRPVLDGAGLGTPDLGTPEPVAWPVDPSASLLGRLDRLEREWSRTTTRTAAR